MSWLVTSIANSLKLDDDDPNPNHSPKNPNNVDDQPNPNPNPKSSPDPVTPRGVKEDLSELSQTLTRQFWGVASFLAPPPQISDRDHLPNDSDQESADPVAGFRSDLSEIGGRFRTGISKLSGNKAVTEFTKIASNLLQFASDEELTVEDYAQRGVVGVTEGVVAFARDVALHPETWLDFPLPENDDEQEFDLSDAQQEHALAVERLAPELAALRIELCLAYMTEPTFWKIYFVLVHPRLAVHDAEILTTPEIARARAILTQESYGGRGKQKLYESGSDNASADASKLSNEEILSVPVIDHSESLPVEIPAFKPTTSVEADLEVDKHTVTSTEIPVIDKAIVEEVPTKQTNIEKAMPSTSKTYDQQDDDDDWLKGENTEGDSLKGTSYPIEDDEEISFSDLEEDDEASSSSKKPWYPNNRTSSDALKNKGSNDWLDVEDLDVA